MDRLIRSHGSRYAAVAILLALTLGEAHPAPTPPAVAARLVGHVPSIPPAAVREPGRQTAHMAALTLTVVLARDDAAGFARHVRDVYDPESPSYRRFLTVEALSDRFGPSPATYDRLAAWLTRGGFEIVRPSRNRLTLTVRAPRAVVERALDVRIVDYRLGDRDVFANDRDPAVPPGLARHVQSIAGLSNVATAQPAIKAVIYGFNVTRCALVLAPIRPPFGTKICVRTDADGPINPYKRCVAAARQAAENNTDFNFDFFQYADLYNYTFVVDIIDDCPPGTGPQGLTAMPVGARATTPVPRAVASGSGQKVGIIALDSFVRSDVADYLAFMGFPAANLDKLGEVHVNGGAGLGAYQHETLLDVTTVMTLATGASVVVYDAPFTGAGTFQALFNAAIDDGATVVSNSWAYCENETTRADVESLDAIFATAAAAGISIFNAAGDSGSTCLNGSPDTMAVPASAPHATAVGGSSVTSGDGQVRISERWWDGLADTPPTGQGGFGVSRFFERPSYQDGHTTSAMRSVPDVVAQADPANGVMICQASAGGCPTGALFGGTSYAAPVWAAFTALINESLGRSIGNANEALYPLAGAPAFRDGAALGSDFAHVGLGSPSVDHIIQRLAGQPAGTPDAGQSIVTPVIHSGYTNGLNTPIAVPADGTTKGYIVVKLRDGNGHLVTGKAVTLAGNPSGNVVITPASGVTDGDGSVLFSVTNLIPESVQFTATDTSDGLELTAKPTLTFAVPRAAAGGIVASLSPVTADGVATSTITVTLRDALDRPTPGKLVTLSQGSGHSLVAAPNPSVTDANGQIAFTVRNAITETVTYTAVDVTDDELPVPGQAVVSFINGTVACGPANPTGQNGYTLTPFTNGFPARDFNYGSVDWGGCPGTSAPAFAPDGVFVAGFVDGDFHKVPLVGGAVTSANKLSTLGPTLSFPVFGKSGKLYALRANTGTGTNSGKVIELDSTTGSELRALAVDLPCASGLAVDPLSGDLFFTNACFGGPQDALLRRLRNPDSATPTLETYATLPFVTNGVVSFAPNGTLYVSSGYNGARAVVRITGTDQPSPPTVTTLAGVHAVFWLTVAETLPNGDAKSLVVLDDEPPPGQDDSLRLVDLTTDPPTSTVIATPGLGSGTIGPDGCLYPVAAGAAYRLTDPSGGCGFAATTANPGISLTPARVAPDPARGTPHTLTATVRNVIAAEGTPVFFEVTGANPRIQMIRADAAGRATFTYAAAQEGPDVVAARATVAGTNLTSNRARVTWTAGKQTTLVSLALSPSVGNPGVPIAPVATVFAEGVSSRTPVAGVPVAFALGTAQCSGTTDASARATCQLTPTTVGTASLTATFAGNEALLGAADAVGFFTSCPAELDGVACYLAVFKTTLESASADDVKKAVRRGLLKKVKKLGKLVTKARQEGKRGEKALKKLGKKLDALANKVERLPEKKMAAALRDALTGLARGARARVP